MCNLSANLDTSRHKAAWMKVHVVAKMLAVLNLSACVSLNCSFLAVVFRPKMQYPHLWENPPIILLFGSALLFVGSALLLAVLVIGFWRNNRASPVIHSRTPIDTIGMATFRQEHSTCPE